MANVLITGCRGGIGLDVVKYLTKRGHFVYASVHMGDSIETTRAQLIHVKDNVNVFKLDILNESDRQIAEDLDIDVLINNAAVGESGPLADISIDRIKNAFETNVFASLSLSQTILKKMIKKGKGKIIFIGSIAGKIPMPFLGPYCMTKFALEGLVHTLRNEVKPLGINIIMINPGSYDTGFNQKNMMKKYEWVNVNKYDKEYLELIKKEEKALAKTQLKNTRNIVKQITLALESNHPKRRYVAPLWQWCMIPIIKLFR